MEQHDETASSPALASPGGELALQDLRVVIEGALAVAGGLLTAGERVLAGRIAALQGPAGFLYARLMSREPEIFRLDRVHYAEVPDPASALATLAALDLAHENVPRSLAIACYTNPELGAMCTELGLPARGRRAELEARLAGVRWPMGRVFRVVGRALVRRLERLWLRRADADRTELLLERMGIRRWVEYRPTGGGAPFPSRGEMLAFEQAMWADPPEPELALARVRASRPRPHSLRRLDARRLWIHHATEGARALERAGEAARAVPIYEGLLDAGVHRPAEIVQRLALALEAGGDREAALAACLDRLALLEPAGRLAVERTGRRLARALRRPWQAGTPLREAPVRQVPLRSAGQLRGRPAWGPHALPVEQAVVAHLGARRALHGENALWTTLFGLVFFDLYWMELPDVLPVPFLAGPLDLGSPDFFERRAEAVEARLAALRAGGGAALLRETWERHAGCQVAGVSWELAPPEALLAVVEGCGPALADILERLAREGWSAARGLPDLVILPGEALRLPGAVPAHLGEGLVFAEIKGPGDSLRDDQRVWLDRMLGVGLVVELWQVVEAT